MKHIIPFKMYLKWSTKIMIVSLSYFVFEVYLSSKQVLPYSMLFLRAVSGKENLDFFVQKAKSRYSFLCVLWHQRHGHLAQAGSKFFPRNLNVAIMTQSLNKKELYVVVISFQSENVKLPVHVQHCQHLMAPMVEIWSWLLRPLNLQFISSLLAQLL